MKHVDRHPLTKPTPQIELLIPSENRAKVVFLTGYPETQWQLVLRETSPKTWQWPKAHEKILLVAIRNANQNPLRFHLTPTETAIIKKDSKQVGDAAIHIHVQVFCVDIHSVPRHRHLRITGSCADYWTLRNKSSCHHFTPPTATDKVCDVPHAHQDLLTVFLLPMSHGKPAWKTFIASLTTGGNNPEACDLWMDEHTVVCPNNGVFVTQP